MPKRKRQTTEHDDANYSENDDSTSPVWASDSDSDEQTDQENNSSTANDQDGSQDLSESENGDENDDDHYSQNSSTDNSDLDSDGNRDSDDEYDHGYDDDEASSQEEDADNPDPYADEPEDLTVDYVLRWIYEEQDVDQNGEMEYIDYPELDCQAIVDRMDTNDLIEVIEALLEKELSDSSESYFDIIKELLELSQVKIEDIDLLNRNLIQAIKANDTDAAEFYRDQGADADSCVEEVIKADSAEMLELLEIELNDENARIAASGNHLEAVSYFLQEDFSACVEGVLTVAARHSNSQLVEAVCEHSELNQAYDLIKFLIKVDGENLIVVFLEHFGVQELLIEIQEQDLNLGFFEIVLNRAKIYLSESEMTHLQIRQLLADFDEKLKITSTFLIFPKENFCGDKKLSAMRDALDKEEKLFDENRLAANFVGITLSPVNRYLTPHPYHSFQTNKSETYFRSTKEHPLSALTGRENTQYKVANPSAPEQKVKTGYGSLSHIGLIKPPHDNLKDFRHTLVSQKKKNQIPSMGTGELYNRLLEFKKNSCQQIVKHFPPDSKATIKVGFYNQYPCIMVFIKKPKFAGDTKNVGAIKAWTELLISFFVGLVNQMARQSGLDIELARRSSFGFLTPTISECGQSFRLNVGIVPQEYLSIIVNCLKILNQVLTLLDHPPKNLKDLNLDMQLPATCFLKQTAYKQYMGKNKIPTPKNVLELAWAKAERGQGGKTAAFNLTRKSIARDGMTAQVYNEIWTLAPNDIAEYAQIFLNCLKWGFNHLGVKGRTLQFNSDEKIKFKSVVIQHVKIADNDFLKLIFEIHAAANKEMTAAPVVKFDLEAQATKLEKETLLALTTCITEKTLAHLYFYLEMLNELLYTRTLFTSCGSELDPYGSDSEDEGGPEELPSQRFYASKVTVRNGMRAILGALHAGANLLFPNYLISAIRHPLGLYGAYYETAEAAKLLSKFDVKQHPAELPKIQILIYDINACVTDGLIQRDASQLDLSNIEILIIDTTSATTQQYRDWIHKFQQLPKLRVLFFVSSGFKNEQMGSDKNPYGTIRIFTKDKNLKNNLVRFIKEMDMPIGSSVSHDYRRMMKRLGNVPTNHHLIHSKTQFCPSTSPAASGSVDQKSTTAQASDSIPSATTSSKSAVALNTQTFFQSAFVMRQGKQISKLYWYEDVEMSLILKLMLAQYQNKSRDDRPVHLLGPLDDISPYGFMDAWIDYDRQPGIVLIPFNLGRLHWVGLVLEFDGSKKLIKANYYDSQGNGVRNSLNTILGIMCRADDTVKVFSAIQDTTLIRQTNGNDCGPCTIANLMSAIGHPEVASDNIDRRLNHLQLLETAENFFYVAFYERQRLNQSSFHKIKTNKSNHSAAKLTDVSSLTEYRALLQLALEIFKLPRDLQEELKSALQDEKKSSENKNDEHAKRIAQIRAVFNSRMTNPAIRPIIHRFFYLKHDDISLAAAPLRLDYNNIAPLMVLLSLLPMKIETDLLNLQKKIISVQPDSKSAPLNVRSRKGLFQPDDKHAKKVKEDIDFQIGDAAMEIGEAYSEGDCFYDSFAQALERLNIAIPTDEKNQNQPGYKKLRMLCSNYAEKLHTASPNKNWLRDQIEADALSDLTYDEYRNNVQYTQTEIEALKPNGKSTWGSYLRDGRMICESLGIKLHMIEIERETYRQGLDCIPVQYIIDEKGQQTDVTKTGVNYEDPKILHMIIYRGHCIPLLPKFAKPSPAKSPRPAAPNSSAAPFDSTSLFGRLQRFTSPTKSITAEPTHAGMDIDSNNDKSKKF